MARLDVPNETGSEKNTKVYLVVKEPKYMKFKTKWAKGRWAHVSRDGYPAQITKTKLIKLKGRKRPYTLVEINNNHWFNITNDSPQHERAIRIMFSSEKIEHEQRPCWDQYNRRISLHKHENASLPWRKDWYKDRYNGFPKIAERLLPFVTTQQRITIYSEPDPKLARSKLK